MALFTGYPAPDANVKFESVKGYSWAYQITQFVQNIAKLTDTQVFIGAVNEFDGTVRIQEGAPLPVVPGTAPGTATALLFVERVEMADPLAIQNLWAIHGLAYISGFPNVQSTILGGFFQGYIANGGGGTVWGVATEAVTEANGVSGTTLIGGEFGVISQINTNAKPLIGCYVVFKDRHDFVTAVVQGLGANEYNNNSRAIQIASIPRSSVGEFCGWSVGIFFDTNCIDNIVGGSGILIDGHRVPVSRAQIGVWIANDVAIRYSDTTNTQQVYYSGSGNMSWASGGTDWFQVNMGSGQLILTTPTVAAATIGTVTPPTMVAGFITAVVNGGVVNIPFYN